MEYNLNFEKFPICFSPIHLPKWAVLYRYSQSLIPPEKNMEPRFFGVYETAKTYDTTFGTDAHDIWACRMNELKLLDVRMMKFMLLEALKDIEPFWLTKLYTIKENPITFSEIIRIFMFAYGLQPREQEVTPSLLSKYGNRQSYTNLDDIAIALMKFIFYPEFDGYISPFLPLANGASFLHEICIFDPSKSIDASTKIDTINQADLKNLSNKNLKDILGNALYYKNNSELIGLHVAQIGGTRRGRVKSGGYEGQKDQTYPKVSTQLLESLSDEKNIYKEHDVIDIIDTLKDLLTIIRERVHQQYMYDAYVNHDD